MLRGKYKGQEVLADLGLRVNNVTVDSVLQKECVRRRLNRRCE